MAEQASRGGHSRIDATELNRVEISDDGRRMNLGVRDSAGRAASFSLPVDSLNTVLTALPRRDKDLLSVAAGEVHRVASWSLARDGGDLVLTLHMPGGASIAFGVKPWQIAAIASLAGCSPVPGRDRLN